MAEKRDVKVTLSLDLGAGGTYALKELSEETKKATAAARDLSAAAAAGGRAAGGSASAGAGAAGTSSGITGGSGRGSPVGSGGGGGVGSSFMSGLRGEYGGVGAGIGRAAAGVFAIHSLGNLAGAVGGAVNDPYTNATQNARNIFKSLPGGEWAQRNFDAITGRTARMEQAGVMGEKMSAYYDNAQNASSFSMGFNPTQAGLAERAAQFRSGSPILPPSGERETATGERAYREQSRLLPLQQQQAKLEREAAVAAKEAVAAKNEQVKVEGKGVELSKERKKIGDEIFKADNPDLYRKPGDFDAKKTVNEIWAGLTGKGVAGGSDLTGGPDRKAAVLNVENLDKAKEANLRQQQAAAEAVRNTEGKAAEARAAAEKNKAAVFGMQADIMGERASAASQAAVSLGQQNPFDRQFGLMSFKQLQQSGPAGMMPEMLSAAMSFGGEDARKIVEKFGAGTAEFAEGGRLGVTAMSSGSPEELRQKEAALRTEAAKADFAADQKLSAVMEESGRKMGDKILDLFGMLLEEMYRRVDSRIAVAHAT